MWTRKSRQRRATASSPSGGTNAPGQLIARSLVFEEIQGRPCTSIRVSPRSVAIDQGGDTRGPTRRTRGSPQRQEKKRQPIGSASGGPRACLRYARSRASYSHMCPKCPNVNHVLPLFGKCWPLFGCISIDFESKYSFYNLFDLQNHLHVALIMLITLNNVQTLIMLHK